MRFKALSASFLICLLIILSGTALTSAGCGVDEEPQPMEEEPPPPPPPTRIENPVVPKDLAVPDGFWVYFRVDARGSQVYDCVMMGTDSTAWQLYAPRADLNNDLGARVGIHYGGIDKGIAPGPYWKSLVDNSTVHGQAVAKTPNPGSIDLLLLKRQDGEGDGMFSKISYIHRLATTGGLVPSSICTAGQRMEVPYTAVYYFYRAP